MMPRIVMIITILLYLAIIPDYSHSEKNGSGLEELITNDRNFVAPGKGGEGILLGEDTAAISGRIRSGNFRVSRFNEILEFYRDVLKVESKYSINFDSIIFFPDRETVLLSLDGKIVSIIGLSNNRITIDSIELRRGMDYILFSYGSEKRTAIKSSRGNIYIYYNNGIAFVDDGPDNSLDMYILFRIKQ
jgi:hypothetical protein